MTMESEAEDMQAVPRDPRSRERRSDRRGPVGRKAEEIAESVWMKLLARASMVALPVVAGFALWAAGQWIADKWQSMLDALDEIHDEIGAIKGDVKETQDTLAEIKLNQAVGITARDDQARRLGRVEDSIIRLWGRLGIAPATASEPSSKEPK